MKLKTYIAWLQSYPEDFEKEYCSDIITFDTKETDLSMLNYHPLICHVEQITHGEHQHDLFEAVQHQPVEQVKEELTNKLLNVAFTPDKGKT